MKVLIWCCGFQQRFAGPFVAKEAKRQGFDVRITGTRARPQRMLVELYSYKPDVVFCFAIRTDLREYYEKIRNTGAKLVLWYPDMTERRRDRMWRGLKGCADALIFSILETAQRYEELAPTVLWMPQYFDHRTCFEGRTPKRLDPNKHIYDVCFIGSCDRLRSRWLDVISNKFDCAFFTDGIINRREVRGPHMTEVYAQSKIAINIQREMFLNPGPFVTSNRMYNAMGSGAFFINHHVERMDLVFEEGKHCISHNDTLPVLINQINFYLENEQAREQIARQGQLAVLQYHTLEQRVKEYWLVMKLVCDGKADSLKGSAYGRWVK